MNREVEKLVSAGELTEAARVLGHPFEVEGVVVEGDRRGKALGFPTANLDVSADHVLPPKGIYAGAALGHRAAISIGVNPHYGGTSLRVEAYLLDFDADLYGRRLVVEVWQRLRDERAFGSEAELIEAIAADVEATRNAVRP
jgi:riboflavin kinase / FMN adenylyltransferase